MVTLLVVFQVSGDLLDAVQPPYDIWANGGNIMPRDVQPNLVPEYCNAAESLLGRRQPALIAGWNRVGHFSPPFHPPHNNA